MRMKLMVDELLELLDRAQKILRYYQGSQVVDMLDDIYRRCCMPEEVGGSNQQSPGLVRESGQVKKASVPKTDKKKRELKSDEDIRVLQEELRSLNRTEAEAWLDLYTKKDLLKFAENVSLSVKNGNKDFIIGQICNHFGYRHLNLKMEQRPPMAR